MGLYPALQSSRADLVDALKEGGRGTSGSARQQRFRKILVGAQVALSVTLLAGASLLIASFVRLSHQDPGFRPDNLWVGFTVMPQAQYPDVASRDAFRRANDERPAHRRRCARGGDQRRVSALQWRRRRPSTRARMATFRPSRSAKARPPMTSRRDGFETLGIPILAGRDFNEQDMADHPNVILISAAGAKSVFGNENPIGKTLLVTSGSVPVEIVGVVGDVRSARLDQQNDMEFYRPFAQENFPFLTITVRSPLPPDSVTKSVQASAEDDRSGSCADSAAADGARSWRRRLVRRR